MELKEREEIIKALECCSVWENCDGCPYRNSVALGCTSKMMRAALALIKELTEENERLHASCTELTQCCTKFETLYKIECKRVDTVKADAVRKMQEKILAKSEYGTINISPGQLDQIAKEMLEENNV